MKSSSESRFKPLHEIELTDDVRVVQPGESLLAAEKRTLETQTALLRVLQECQFERVWGSRA
jgi:hypothetical protein